MRVMVIVKATQTSEAGTLPSTEMLAAMGKYNEELAQAGILLAADGLQPATRRPRYVPRRWGCPSRCSSRAPTCSSPG